MVDDAIDLFNVLEASRAFLAETVQGLHEAIRRGDLEPSAGESLDEADVQAVAGACQALAERMAPTRAALETLKTFVQR